MVAYPDGALGLLILPLIFSLFERQKIWLNSFFIICVLVGGVDGLAAGSFFYIVYYLFVSLALDFFTDSGDSNLSGVE